MPVMDRGLVEVQAPETPLEQLLQEQPLRHAITIGELDSHYGAKQVLRSVSMDLPERHVTAFVGPSGCGKSTALRCLNRMNDTISGFRMSGRIELQGQDINGPGVNVNTLRRVVGMVFQAPNPFPMSIKDNIALAIREHERDLHAKEIDRRVREALEQASLWDEVGDSLSQSALALSGGQQQRLCIARALAVRPSVLMLDEPCASLDPISTAAIERLLLDLKREYTIVIVTHNLAQARRISDYCGFFLMGELVEYGPTDQLFTDPRRDETARYLSGDYG
jgi:phosphate transport system ATP-binding protein